MRQCHSSRRLFLNRHGLQVLVHKIPSFSILRTTNSLSLSPLTISRLTWRKIYFIGIAPTTLSVTSCSGLWTDLRPLWLFHGFPQSATLVCITNSMEMIKQTIATKILLLTMLEEFTLGHHSHRPRAGTIKTPATTSQKCQKPYGQHLMTSRNNGQTFPGATQLTQLPLQSTSLSQTTTESPVSPTPFKTYI